jgi:centrosomal protein CEP290
MRIEIIEMEIAVQQRFGYLERYKDMANFRIMTLQKKLEESIPVSKMDALNVEYNNLVQNYRQMLDKQDNNEALAISLQQNEQLNKKFEAEINFLKKELENEKEKAHLLEENLSRMKIPFLNPTIQYHSGLNGQLANGNDMLNNDSNMNTGMISMAKRLTALEMKELNERQKADHAQRMYDQQRGILREIENRNLELEQNFSQLSKKYLNLEKSETLLREQLCSFVPKSVDDANKQRIQELEKQEHLLKLEISRLRELTEITLYQTASLDFINNINKMMLPSFSLAPSEAIREINPDDLMDRGKMHRQLILMQISEATAVRKLQQAQSRVKKLEGQLIKTEQKYDRDNNDFFNQKKEYISKITYLRSTIQVKILSLIR